MTLSVKEVMKKWLANRGYRGLCTDDCGCDIDDLFPCGNCTGRCTAAYAFECERCGRKNCEKRNDDFGVLYSDRKDFCKPLYEGDEPNDRGEGHEARPEELLDVPLPSRWIGERVQGVLS